MSSTPNSTPSASSLIPPTEGAGDAAHAAARMLIGVVPIVGGTAVEVFNLIVGPPVQKHLATWREDLARRLIDLIRDVADVQAEVERLQANDQFIATTLEATRIAAVTRSQEKLDALRNAVLNVAAGIDVGEIERQMFLRYVDELTEAHLRILSYGAGTLRPKEIANYNGWIHASPAQVLTTTFAELAQQPELSKRLWKDLVERGLIMEMAANDRRFTERWRESWPTEFGSKFIHFISAPSTTIGEQQA